MIPEIPLEINPYTGLLEHEVWKDINGFEGQISNYGRVKSLPKTKAFGINADETLLRLASHNHKYLKVNLYKDHKCHSRLVHRLVAEAFIPNPVAKRTVNHKRGIKVDNRAWQLEWATYSENEKHAFKVGLKSHKGVKAPLTKLNSEDIDSIRKALKDGYRNLHIAFYFDVPANTISNIKLNKSFL